MRNFILVLTFFMVAAASNSQTTNNTETKLPRERPGPHRPRPGSMIRMEDTTEQKSLRKVPPLALRWQPPRPSEKFNANFGRVSGVVLVAGGSVLMAKMHEAYNEAKEQREKRRLLESQGYPVQYPKHGDGSIARGIGVFFSNAFIAGGTALFIIGTKKLQKYKAAHLTIGASPHGTNIVYTF